MKKILLISIFCIGLLGCERYLDSRDPVRPFPTADDAPINLSIEINSEAILLSWEHPGATDVIRYRVYASPNDTFSYLPVDSTTGTSILLDELTSNTQYFLRVAAVYSGGWEGPRSAVFTTRIGLLSMSINNGNPYTNNRTVGLQFTFPVTISYVKISENPTLADAGYIDFSPSLPYMLSDGDGVKYLYASLMFADGSVSGDILTDSITLDTRAFINSVSFAPTGTTFNEQDTIYFYLTSDELGGSASVTFDGAAPVSLYDNGRDADATADDGVYSGWFLVPVSLDLVDGIVTGSFIDQAGNNAPSVTAYDLLNIDTTP